MEKTHDFTINSYFKFPITIFTQLLQKHSPAILSQYFVSLHSVLNLNFKI